MEKVRAGWRFSHPGGLGIGYHETARKLAEAVTQALYAGDTSVYLIKRRHSRGYRRHIRKAKSCSNT